MEIEFNVTGSERQRLVSALVALTEQPKEYQGAPSMAYKVGDYLIDKAGTLIVPDDADSRAVNMLVDKLYEQYGFYTDNLPEQVDIATDPEDTSIGESTEDEPEPEASVAPTEAADAAEDEEPPTNPPAEEEAAEAPEAPDVADPESAALIPENGEPEDEPEGDDRVTLSLPITPFKDSIGSVDRLKALITSKQTLLKHALETDSLEIVVTDDKVSFPWFTVHEAMREEEVDAYIKLILAMTRLAVTQKRVSSDEKANDDEKLAMRLFLIRLGFIGDDYKSARSILTRNLAGKGYSRSASAAEFTLDAPQVIITNTAEAKEGS